MDINTVDSGNIIQQTQEGDYAGVWRGNTFGRLPMYRDMEPFNVRRFHPDAAALDGEADYTDTINETIRTCVSEENALYDIVIPGVAKVGGPAITDLANGFNNCQIAIPPASFGDGTLCHVTIRGSSRPTWVSGGANENIAHSMKGPLLISTRTTAGGVMPCMIGGSNTGGAFNYNFLTVKDLGILLWAGTGTAASPVIGGINGFNLASVIVEDCLISINRAAYQSAVPSDQIAGIITTRRGGESMTTIKRVLCNGLYYSYILGEHAVAEGAQAFNCAQGFTILPSFHSIKMRDCLSSWCAYPIAMSNSDFLGETRVPTQVNIDHFQVEVRTGPVWNATRSIITDQGNWLEGKAFYQLSMNGDGEDVSTDYMQVVDSVEYYVKDGAKNLQAGPLTTGQFEIKNEDERPTRPRRAMRLFNVATGRTEEYDGAAWVQNVVEPA